MNGADMDEPARAARPEGIDDVSSPRDIDRLGETPIAPAERDDRRRVEDDIRAAKREGKGLPVAHIAADYFDRKTRESARVLTRKSTNPVSGFEQHARKTAAQMPRGARHRGNATNAGRAHSGHGVATTSPKPPHCGQARVVMT
jgi:hypothetical protein